MKTALCLVVGLILLVGFALSLRAIELQSRTMNYLLCLKERQLIILSQGHHSIWAYDSLIDCDQYLPEKK